MKQAGYRRSGFSILELVMVVGILTLLAALLMPAIHSARSTARDIRCRNNLRQLGQAIQNYESSTRHLPYGGWGPHWFPVPGREREMQPGGWLYGVLPHIEMPHPVSGSLADTAPHLAKELKGIDGSSEAPPYVALLSQPLAAMNCPERRRATPYPIGPNKSLEVRPYGTLHAGTVARGDYAFNAGGTVALMSEGPASLDDPEAKSRPLLTTADGLIHYRHGVALKHVLPDGLSNTYLIGEKYLFMREYDTGTSLGDDEHMYSGFSSDNARFTALFYPPARDDFKFPHPNLEMRFGSPHAHGVNFVFCSGHVDTISFDVDPLVHFRYGTLRRTEPKHPGGE